MYSLLKHSPYIIVPYVYLFSSVKQLVRHPKPSKICSTPWIIVPGPLAVSFMLSLVDEVEEVVVLDGKQPVLVPPVLISSQSVLIPLHKRLPLALFR